MAEFIGGENKFSGLLTSIFNGFVSILEENGLVGLFSGLMPRLLGEVGVLGITSALTFIVNNYVVEDKELNQYSGHIAGFLAGSICYPFQVRSREFF